MCSFSCLARPDTQSWIMILRAAARGCMLQDHIGLEGLLPNWRSESLAVACRPQVGPNSRVSICCMQASMRRRADLVSARSTCFRSSNKSETRTGSGEGQTAPEVTSFVAEWDLRNQAACHGGPVPRAATSAWPRVRNTDKRIAEAPA